MTKTTIINLLAGPSAGKSTIAAGLFYEMKLAGYKVELITEYAKELVYADRTKVLRDDQLYVFAKQNHRMANTVGKVDYIITDCCLLFSNVYGEGMPGCFYDLVIHTYNQYKNLDFFIERPSTFQEYGRVHNLQQSIEIDNKIKSLLKTHCIESINVKADDYTVPTILAHIKMCCPMPNQT